MTTELIGEICALATAMTWAVAVVLFKRSGECVSPFALNLFKNVVGLILLTATLVVMPGAVDILYRSPRQDMVILLASGLLGIALSDTLFFYCLDIIGVGLTSVATCLYGPFAVLFSYLILTEELGFSVYGGTALILGGILISSRHTPPADRTQAQLVAGITLGALSMALVTLGVVMAKPVLQFYDFPLILALVVRMAAGTLVLALLGIASPSRKKHWSVFRPSSIWKFSIPASALGAYITQIVWIAGYKYAKASIAGLLNQTTIIFAIVLATLVLKESLTRRKLAAVVLASTGAAMLKLL